MKLTRNIKKSCNFKIVITSIGLVLLGACSDSMHTSYFKESYSSNGERIYLTGQSNRGTQIRAIGGHHHTQMHGGGCATCHGGNREGGASMWPWFWKMAPALTSTALLGDHEGDGHSHLSYTRESLKRVITEGFNPEGKSLDELMPRWKLSDDDLDDLVTYLLNDDDAH
ncbi:MAG: c-type cytochrome [Gammaproteobacteria bacterium]|nr:c-type cytochrome [Gammaproteobacteria bacterium]